MAHVRFWKLDRHGNRTEVTREQYHASNNPDAQVDPPTYPDDGKHCPECGTPLTVDKRADEAYCENCNFVIFDYSEEV